MRISVFAVDSNPAVDRFYLRKSAAYCRAEVAAGRAKQVDAADITKGIQLVPVNPKGGSELRGSAEACGCVTAHESQLNAEYRHRQSDKVAKAVAEGRACFIVDAEVAQRNARGVRVSLYAQRSLISQRSNIFGAESLETACGRGISQRL